MRPVVPLLLRSSPRPRPGRRASERPLRDVPPAERAHRHRPRGPLGPDRRRVNTWYHVGSGRESAGPHRLRAPLRAPHVRGLEERARGGASTAGSRRWAATTTARPRTTGRTTGRTCPSNALEMPLFLESDRMGFLLDAMSPGDGGRPARRRQERAPPVATRTGPTAWSSDVLLEALYPKDHPYSLAGHRLDGGPLRRELRGRRGLLQEVVRPGQRRASSIAGDVDAKAGCDARGEVVRRRPGERAGRARSLPQPVVLRGGEAPRPRGPGPAAAPLPRLADAAGLRPGRRAPSTRLAGVLASGKNSRLYKRLVYDLQVAQDVTAYQEQRRARLDVHDRGHRARRATPRGDPRARRRGDRPAAPRSRPRSARSTRFRNQTEARASTTASSASAGFGGKADQLNAYYFGTGQPRLLRGGPRPLPRARAERRAGRRLALPRARAGSSLSVVPEGKKDLAVPEVTR